MKKPLALISLFLVPILFLSACAGASSSWPNASADAQNAYIAAGPYVHAINLKNHEEAWKFPDKPSTANPFLAAPSLSADGKQLIVCGYDKKVYSLDPQTGKTNWQFPPTGTNSGAIPKDRFIGGALVTADGIYAPNADYNLYALTLQGKPKWDAPFEANQSIWGEPVSDGTNIYFGTLGRTVYAVNAGTGKQVWKQSVDGAIFGSPALDQKNKILYVGTYVGTLYALSTSNGSIQGQPVKKSGTWIWSGPALDDTNIYVGYGNGTLSAISQSNHEVVWQKDGLNGSFVGTPLVVGKVLVIGTDNPTTKQGQLYFFDPKTGNKLDPDFSLADKTENGQAYSHPLNPPDSNMVLVPLMGSAKDPILLVYDLAGKYQWQWGPQ